jgi:hypothetical protein
MGMGTPQSGTSKTRLIRSWKRIIFELELLLARLNNELQQQDLTEAEAADTRQRRESVLAQLSRAYEELQRVEK